MGFVLVICVLFFAMLTLTIGVLHSKKSKKKKLLRGSKRLQTYEIRYLHPNFKNSEKQKPLVHPHYIFAEKENDVLSINTTHQKPKHKRVIRLSHNPNPNDNRPTYAVKEIHTTSKEVSKKHRDMRKKGWYYHPEDIKLMEEWIKK